MKNRNEIQWYKKRGTYNLISWDFFINVKTHLKHFGLLETNDLVSNGIDNMKELMTQLHKHHPYGNAELTRSIKKDTLGQPL